MAKVVAFDTETKGLDWFDPAQGAFLASWADEHGEYHCDLQRNEGTSKFLDAITSADVVVCHNLSFDLHQLREATGLDLLESQAELHDTDLQSRVLFPEGQRKGERGGHGLKNLATIFLDSEAGEAEEKIEEMADSMGVKLRSTGGYHEVWRAYPEVMEHYARKDARFTYDLFVRFQGEFDDATTKVYDLEIRVAPVLIRAEARGIAVDPEAVDALHREYQQRRECLHDSLARQLGEDALGGAGSEEALLDALLGMGVPLHRKTDTGKVSTNKFALQEFEDDFPVIAELSEFRQVNKFLSTYIEPAVGREVVHTSFRQIGAWTGRMSSARPNMQNIPKSAGNEVRGIFVPRPEHSFIVVDYEGIEIRLLAHYLNDAGFRKLIADGLDPHAWMATNLHGGEIEDYVKGSDGEALRSAAKNTLFAITYGAGKRRITDMNKLSPEPHWEENHPAIVAARQEGRMWPKPGYQYKEAAALIRQIKSALPGYHKLNKRIRRKVEDVGHVNTIMGRRNPVKPDKAYVGLNALIQGSAADVMKQGLVNVDEAVKGLGGCPLLVVHDEVVIEIPTESAKAAYPLVEEALCSAYPLDPPLAVEGSIVDTNYADA